MARLSVKSRGKKKPTSVSHESQVRKEELSNAADGQAELPHVASDVSFAEAESDSGDANNELTDQVSKDSGAPISYC